MNVLLALAAAISISTPWSRPAMETGVVYLTIANHSSVADRLIGGTSPVASAVELHESTHSMAPMNGQTNGMPMDVASMHRVASIPVGPHGTVKLAPGGYHIMLIGLHHDLRAGGTIPLRLHFARAGWVRIDVPVQKI